MRTTILEHLEAGTDALRNNQRDSLRSRLCAIAELVGGCPPFRPCKRCSKMKARYTSFSCGDHHVPLDPEAKHLLAGVDLSSGGGRSHAVVCCKTCGQRWSVATDYEFLVGGSEDYLYVTRLDPAELVQSMLDSVDRGGNLWEDWSAFRRGLESADLG